jgi:hypothetical protein
MSDQLSMFDPDGGRADRDAGMTAALGRAKSWVDAARVVIAWRARKGDPFTSEDVTAVVGQPPEGCSPNAVGAVMNAAAKAGQIRRVGDAQARRRNQHATRIGLWVGVTAEDG